MPAWKDRDDCAAAGCHGSQLMVARAPEFSRKTGIPILR